MLRQLRDGYPQHPKGFPSSLALVGLRDVADYKVSPATATGSGQPTPFNIKVESFTLRDFTAAEVDTLYAQHTAETGQVFARAR